MKIEVEGKTYNVNIIKKKIKNTYIRVKEDLEIYVTTNTFTPNGHIEKLIKENEKSITKMINRQKKRQEKNENFYLLGKKYDVILCNIFKEATIDENKIYVKNLPMLDRFKRDYAKKVFTERLNLCYNKMGKTTIYPRLNIRKMKGKWGYCNKKDKLITLNLELIKYDVDEIDYVIVHELCHFIHFNHSASFWKEVEKWKPNYKKNRKILREE